MAVVTQAIYNPVGEANSSFKQPRQKMWGVFNRPNDQYGMNYWQLVLLTNDLQAAKDSVNDWMKNPPQGQYAKPGLDNVILCEVAPVDSTISI